VPSGGKINGVDPHCIAYKRIFDEIRDRLDKEMFGSSSLETATFGMAPMNSARTGIMSIMVKKLEQDI
jgi:uncharacterized protein